MFDAQESLHEGSFISNAETAAINSTRQPISWRLGTLFLLLILMFQVYHFEAYNLSQNISLRPWLKTICSAIPSCQFPLYRNTAEFKIIKSSFQPANGHFVFNTAFVNRSIFAQEQPSIQLTLIDFSGHVFAKRLFHPKDYSTQPQVLIKPNLSETVTMDIAAPANKVGGFRFELI